MTSYPNRTSPVLRGKWVLGNLLGAHGKALTKLGKHAEAEAALLEAYNILHDAAGESHKRTLEAARALADLYEAWGKADKAAQWRAKAPGAPPPPVEKPQLPALKELVAKYAAAVGDTSRWTSRALKGERTGADGHP